MDIDHRASESKLTVIYIAGVSHSGSTLLDLMLNAHPEIASVGELAKLHKRFRSGNREGDRCTCGARPFLRCAFWSSVNVDVEQLLGKALSDLEIGNYQSVADCVVQNEALYRAISNRSGRRFIVDSSKSPQRLAFLLRHCNGLNVLPVYIVRNPKGHVRSMQRKYNAPMLRCVVNHEIRHFHIRRALDGTRHVGVRYETLVSSPEETLQRILTPLGLLFDARQRAWGLQEKHHVSGNRMRRQTSSDLVVDEKWRTDLSAGQKLAIDLGTFWSQRAAARAYGSF